MKKDFLRQCGTPPLFQTDQQKCNNLKRERDLLEDANVQMIKRLKHSEMCMRNLQNQKSIRAKRSTDPKQARQRFLDACKEYHSPTHSGYVCVWGAEIDVCIFIFVCVVFVVVVAWVLFSLFLKGNQCNYTNKTKKFRLRRAINAIVVYIYILRWNFKSR